MAKSYTLIKLNSTRWFLSLCKVSTSFPLSPCHLLLIKKISTSSLSFAILLIFILLHACHLYAFLFHHLFLYNVIKYSIGFSLINLSIFYPIWYNKITCKSNSYIYTVYILPYSNAMYITDLFLKKRSNARGRLLVLYRSLTKWTLSISLRSVTWAISDISIEFVPFYSLYFKL